MLLDLPNIIRNARAVAESRNPTEPAMGVVELDAQLTRANRIIGWMIPYIGNMCPPENGLFDLNNHCFENHVPTPDKSTKGRPISQGQ